MDRRTARTLTEVVDVLVKQQQRLLKSRQSLAAEVLSIAIMEIRLGIHDISDEELRALSDVLLHVGKHH